MNSKETATVDYDRPDFEMFMAKKGYINNDRFNDGEYMSSHFVSGWEAWKSAKEHERERQKASLQAGEPIDPGPCLVQGQVYSLDGAGDAFIAFGEALNNPATTLADLVVKANRCGFEIKFPISGT